MKKELMPSKKYEGILIWDKESMLKNKTVKNNNLEQDMRIWMCKLEINSKENKKVLDSFKILSKIKLKMYKNKFYYKSQIENNNKVL